MKIRNKGYFLHKKTLVLDLDETLFYTSMLDDGIKYDFQFELYSKEYFVIFQKNLKEFIEYVESNFNIIVWTTATHDYASIMVEKIFSKETIILSRNDNSSTFISQYKIEQIEDNEKIYYSILRILSFYLGKKAAISKLSTYSNSTLSHKPLKKVVKRFGLNLKDIVAIDNDPEKFHSNYGNYLYIKNFYGGDNDSLLKLKEKLEIIKDLDDVRTFKNRL